AVGRGPSRRAESRSRGLALRQLLGRPRSPDSGCFPRPDHRRRPQDADGHAALCGGRRRGLALGQSRRRQRACYRHCPYRGHQKSGRREGAAGWGTGGSARRLGYIFSRAQWLRREGKATEAAELILSVPDDPTQALDADQWRIERRFVSRTLLDLDDAKTAYRVASAAAVPSRQNYRVEHQFTSGWIALRFLNDASTAFAHFAKVGQGASNPITLARAYYWQGPAAEALGKTNDARALYEMAARSSTAYYGQLARARLGLKDTVMRSPPDRASARADVVSAIEILYNIGERDLIAGGLAELGDRSRD